MSVNKTSLMIIGGFGQESEAAIVDLKYKTYQHLEPLKQPRRQVNATTNFLNVSCALRFL